MFCLTRSRLCALRIIQDLPKVPYYQYGPHREEYKSFRREDLANGVREGIQEEELRSQLMSQMEQGRLISSSLMVFKGLG